MKKILLLAVIFFSFTACKKYVHPEKQGAPSILGKWNISDYYFSPGTGVNINAIPWMAADPSNKNYLEFKEDGRFIYSLDFRATPDQYNLTDSALYIIRDGKQIRLGYKLSKPYLEIYGNISFEASCIEFCGTRYTPAE